jgi:hypothetical protein
MHGHVAHPERSFGISVGGAVCALAGLLVWRGRIHPAEVAAPLGGLLVGLGLLKPRLLALPSAIWWKFVRALGYVNTRVVLTLLFALVLTPIGLAFRLVGKDPLGQRRGRAAGWTTYPARYRDRRHYSRLY